jgi:hypothetical protein
MIRFFRIMVASVLGIMAVPAINSFGQLQHEGMVKYTPDFRFKDGIYVNFDQVKENNPIPKAKLLTSADYNDKEFFKKVLESDKIYYYDAMGIRQEIAKNTIWGYARNGVIYVQIQENFNRITFIGSISHFVADVTTLDYRNSSPYGYGGGYYDPYYYPYSSYGSPYGSYYSPYGRNYSTRNEIKQYLIDFETGKMYEFNLESTELLLKADVKLYEEYMNLPRKKKRDLMFVYIRKFNDENPLFIPVNQQ